MTTPIGVVGEFEEQDRPKRCLWVKQDYCRNQMRGIDDNCLKCLADKVNKARNAIGLATKQDDSNAGG